MASEAIWERIPSKPGLFQTHNTNIAKQTASQWGGSTEDASHAGPVDWNGIINK